MMTVILTGGASRRMGRDKALLELRGKPLVELLAERYSVMGEVVISAARADSFPRIKYRVLPDLYPGCGPVNGIVSAFRQTGEKMVFLTAVDLPFGDVKLARLLAEWLEDHDACIIRRTDGRDEPTFAAYSRTSLQKAEACMAEGHHSFKKLLPMLNVRRIMEKDIPQFDLGRILLNMNDPEKYKYVAEEM